MTNSFVISARKSIGTVEVFLSDSAIKDARFGVHHILAKVCKELSLRGFPNIAPSDYSNSSDSRIWFKEKKGV